MRAADIEDIYELTPLQQGLLYHVLHATGSREYFTHFSCRLRASIDLRALRDALATVLARHPALRTSLHWEDVPKPLQVVHRSVELPLVELDWTGASRAEESARTEALIEEETRRGFALDAAPLLRMTVIRLGEDLWRFLFVHNHLVLDGWSFAVILREVFLLTEARRSGVALELPPAPPFATYVGWLQEVDQGPAERHWRELLAGFREPTPLTALEQAAPGGPPRGAERGRVEAALGEELAGRLRRRARAEHLTLNTLVLGAWAVLLARLSGEEDVVFGATSSGRPPELAGSDAMVGLFINTLPIRARVRSDAQLFPWLRGLQEQEAAARGFESSSLVQVQRWSEVPPGRALFDTIVVFENLALDTSVRERTEALAIEEVRFGTQGNHGLNLIVDPDRALSATLLFDPERFAAGVAQGVLDRLAILLESIADAGVERLGELELTTAAERALVLETWNRTDAPLDDLPRFDELVWNRAAGAPDAPAVVDGERSWTYAELTARADAIACRLRREGVGPEVRVGLLVERSAEVVAAILGVLRAGGAYVPLDPALPEERLRHVLRDSGAALVVTSGGLADRLLPPGTRVLALDGEGAGADASEAPEGPDAGPQHLAYVMYTSGSTGLPKGVEIERRGLVNLARHQHATLGLGAGDRVLQLVSFGFDASFWDLSMTLTEGATLVVAPKEARFSAAVLTELLERERITALTAPPSLLAELDPAALPDLALVTSTGEACSAELVRAWAPGRRLLNGYGPTETTVGATIGACEPDDGRPTIGTPFANTRVYVLDARMQPVPVGFPGELHVGGVGVARCYTGRARETAERFVPDPFGPDLGGRLYRTGDLARWRPDGRLEFLGRVDRMVKLRGLRVELEEVESVLAACEGVAECVVLVREDRPGRQRLVAYVTAEAAAEPDPAELRALARERLPAAMVPAAIVRLDAFPRLSSGKIDHGALPAPHGGPDGEAQLVLPRTDEERRLAAIWCEVLDLETVSVEEDFFDLGGDSILSIRVIAEANRVGLELTPRHLLTHRTIADLATVVGSGRVAAEQGPVVGEVVLTPMQRTFFESGLEELSHFNQAFLIQVPVRLDAGVLERVVGLLVAHHDGLRTAFEEGPDGWRARVPPPAPGDAGVALVVHDLSAAAAGEAAREVERVCAELQGGFDLGRGPLFRVAWFDRGPEEPGRVLFLAHHLVVDGVSWRVLLEDFQTAYLAILSGEEPSLPAKTSSLVDWGRRLEEHGRSPELAAELEHWLAPLVAAPLPVDREGAGGLDSAAVHTLELEVGETERFLRTAGRGRRADALLLAAWADALARWSGEPRLLVDVESHGRDELLTDVDVSRTVGWFTAVFPLPLDLAGAGDVEACHEVVAAALARVPRRGLGAGLIRHGFAGEEPAARLRALPRAEVSFNYLGRFDAGTAEAAGFGVAPEAIGPLHGTAGTRPYLLQLDGSVTGERLRLQLVRGDRHRAETADRLLASVGESLRTLLAALEPGREAGAGATGAPADDRRARLVPLGRAADGGRPTLFLPHGGGGDVQPYRFLARELETHVRPVAIRSRALATDEREHASIEAMAREYVRLVRGEEPRGPYHLLGWSMGGVVAIAMAAELEAEGEEVAFLGSIDDGLGEEEADGAVLAEVRALLDELTAGLGLAAPAEAVLDRLAATEPEARMDRLVDWLAERGLVGARDPGGARRRFELFEEHRALCAAFRPPVLRVEPVRWCRRDGAAPEAADALGLPRAEPVAGSHLTMLYPPNVRALGGSVRRRLDRVSVRAGE
jgi:amino acid adenylation domain-containing protein/non-ribosomal peptide synthase protein (TIGR01720 family)